MAISSTPRRNAFLKPTADVAGVALVIVLAFVVLLSGLVVAFLVMTTTDVSSSRAYARGTTTKQMSDAAVNLVIAQIKDATSGTDASTTPAKTLAWASQPGMIRTWDDVGNLNEVFKLYSSSQLSVSGANFNLTPTADYDALTSPVWNADAAGKSYTPLYADLNSPVADAASDLHYPIMDPSGDTSSGDPSKMIEGFHITAPPGYVASTPAGPTNNPAPMPVRWLYVLQDGKLAQASANGTKNQVKIGTGAADTPTADNPIVGRVAFWTDDDTCKVNLNTASEPTFWDMPRVQTHEEHGGADILGYANSVPTSTEYQRVPGHPATTSLSSVLGYHFDPAGSRPSYLTKGDTADYIKYLQPYYDLVPRVSAGGSQGGTVSFTIAQHGADPLTDNDRLYASIDELIFNAPSVNPRSTVSSAASYRGINGQATGVASAFTKADIEKVRFFLTANSRAPELNLFNKPRISLWPLMQDTTPNTIVSPKRNAKDDLIAFCTSLGIDSGATKKDARTGKYPYFFQRYKAFIEGNNKTAAAPQGANVNSLNYITPGSSQSTTDDLSTLVPRNSQLLSYLHDLTNLPVPGFGGKLSEKYGTDNDQILMECFDYIRSLVNTTSLNSTVTTSNYNFAPFNSVNPASNGDYAIIGAGAVVPARNDANGTMGLGRFITIRGVSILFYATDFKDTSKFSSPDASGKYSQPDSTHTDGVPDDEPDLVSDGGNPPAYTIVYHGVGEPRTKSIRAIVLINPTLVAPGIPSISPAVRYEITGLENLQVSWNGNDAVSLNMAADQYQTVQSNVNLGFDADSGVLDALCWKTGGIYDRHHPNQIPTQAQINARRTRGFLNTISSDSPDLTTKYLPFASIANVPIGNDLIGYPPPLPFRLRWPCGTDGDTQSSDEPTFHWAGPHPAPGGHPLHPGETENNLYFYGGSIVIKVYSGLYQEALGTLANAMPSTRAPLVQQYDITFPATIIPMPQIARATTKQFIGALSGGTPSDLAFYTGYTTPSSAGTFDINSLDWNKRLGGVNSGDPVNAYYPPGNGGYFNPSDTANRQYIDQYGAIYGSEAYNVIFRPGDVVRTMAIDPNGPAKGDIRLIAAMPEVFRNYFAPLTGYDDSNQYQVVDWIARGEENIDGRNAYGFNGYVIQNGAPVNPRDWAGKSPSQIRGKLVKDAPYSEGGTPVLVTGLNGILLTNNIAGPYSGQTANGDFDNGLGNFADGPFINKPDEGYGLDTTDNVYYPSNFKSASQAGGGFDPNVSYTPNRQMPSAVMLGSLPTGVKASHPWQTLLFCANPAAADKHPGFGVSKTDGTAGAGVIAPYKIPPDHLYLDLFSMPVVDPYAISEAFSTAGKVNMNYQIQPFTNIERSTAMHAVMKGIKIQAINVANAGRYKTDLDGREDDYSYRFDLDATATLTGFTNRFNGLDIGGNKVAPQDIFHSASEICDIFLVPRDTANSYPWKVPQLVQGPAPSAFPGVRDGDTAAAAAIYRNTPAWWNDYTLTGDNSREAPYNMIYPRLTTKSNTYTVHVRVQALTKVVRSSPATWDESKDQVASEYRGSTAIERYIDPADQTIPDFAGYTVGGIMGSALNMDHYYQFRIVSTKQFQP